MAFVSGSQSVRGVYFAQGQNGAAFGRFRPQLEWLQAAPPSGTIAAGGSTPVLMTFDAAALLGGTYHARATFQSNDPDDTPVVFATLHVAAAPNSAVSDTPLDCGQVFVGSTRSRNLDVLNNGTDELHVSHVALTGAFFAADSLPFDLSPGSERTIAVSFTPGAPTASNGAL